MSRDFCSDFHQVEIRVSAGAAISSEAQTVPLPNSLVVGRIYFFVIIRPEALSSERPLTVWCRVTLSRTWQFASAPPMRELASLSLQSSLNSNL